MAQDLPAGFVKADLGLGFSNVLGTVYVDRAARRMRWQVDEAHINPAGALHGGALATFADAQLVAIRPGIEAGRPHSPTISLSVDYVAPATLGDWVEAEVTLIRLTRTMMFTQAVLSVNGAPIGRSTAIYRNYEPLEDVS